MKPARCARCEAVAEFAVSAGDSSTFWHRSQAVCLACLPGSKRWAGFVGPVTVVPVGDWSGSAVQGLLFEPPEVHS